MTKFHCSDKVPLWFLIRRQNFLKACRTCSFKASPFGRGGGTSRRRGFICRDRRPLAVWSIFFFQAKKKEAKKSLVTTTATVSRLTPRVAIINCSPLWLRIVHRTIRLTHRAPALRNRTFVRGKTKLSYL